jgi:hypothetical protein
MVLFGNNKVINCLYEEAVSFKIQELVFLVATLGDSFSSSAFSTARGDDGGSVFALFILRRLLGFLPSCAFQQIELILTIPLRDFNDWLRWATGFLPNYAS